MKKSIINVLIGLAVTSCGQPKQVSIEKEMPRYSPEAETLLTNLKETPPNFTVCDNGKSFRTRQFMP